MSSTPALKLYHYWRSSCSWRVRWALAYKNIDCEFITVNLLNGESESPEHLARNPLGYVPVLTSSDMVYPLAESMAIMEWLEERFPHPSLFPLPSNLRAICRQMAEIINAATQPLQNMGVQELHSSLPTARREWAAHWIGHGLTAFEKLASIHAGTYSIGNSITTADFCLIPQCYNALRNELNLDRWPTVHRIYQNALQHPSCQASHPDRFAPT